MQTATQASSRSPAGVMVNPRHPAEARSSTAHTNLRHITSDQKTILATLDLPEPPSTSTSHPGVDATVAD